MTGFTFPEPIQRLMLEMRVEALERSRRAVLADPVKNKLTLHFPEGARLNSLYYPVDKATFPKVRYCYSTERNLAGYFLGWRETVDRKGNGKRDQWIASKRRKTVDEKSRARAKAHSARVQPKAKAALEERKTTYWASEHKSGPNGTAWTRGLGKIVTTGGPNNALDKALARWPDLEGDIRVFHIGRK